MEEFVAQSNIISETKAHRLRRLAHLETMGEKRNVKRAYLGRSTEQDQLVAPCIDAGRRRESGPVRSSGNDKSTFLKSFLKIFHL